jgi:oxygen-independent coproporphyrinogen-3 oxidase
MRKESSSVNAQQSVPSSSDPIDTELGLYVHIPFCKYRCSYCDFATFAGQDDQIAAYVDALLAELRLRSDGRRMRLARTLFFGGGTPSHLPSEFLARIIEQLAGCYFFTPGMEVTLESNPGTLSMAHLAALRSAGINRLSIGVQSLNDQMLRSLDRIHTAAEALAAIRLGKKAGFRSVNADLIFGLPGQTTGDWRRTLHGVVAEAPDHISAYGLIVEPGTLLKRQVDRRRVTLPSDDDAATMYEYLQDYLGSSGYVQYEISNWARPGHACAHNLIYWRHDPYLGLGLSAHSYLDGRRFANVRGLQGYIRRLQHNRLPTASTEVIDAARARADATMVGLRLTEGIHVDSFNRRFGGDFLTDHAEPLTRLRALGLLEQENGYVRLTGAGMLLANQVWMEFL